MKRGCEKSNLKKRNFGARFSGFKLLLWPLLTVWLWASHRNFLSLSFFLWKMEVTTVTALEVDVFSFQNWPRCPAQWWKTHWAFSVEGFWGISRRLSVQFNTRTDKHQMLQCDFLTSFKAFVRPGKQSIYRCLTCPVWLLPLAQIMGTAFLPGELSELTRLWNHNFGLMNTVLNYT